VVALVAMASTADAIVVKEMKQLAEGYSPLWSPDGKKIAYLFNSDIWVIDNDGSNQKQLTFNASVYDLSWSPTSKKITFASPNGVWVIDNDGSNQKQLTFNAPVYQSSWSPSGKKIVFSQEDGIWVINADGSNKARLTDGSHIETTRSLLENTYLGAEWDLDYYPSWSPDGSKIAFIRTLKYKILKYNVEMIEYLHNLYTIEADGSNPTLIMEDVTELSPVWSPDGKKIAFIKRNVEKRGQGIFVAESDGSDYKQLTNASSFDYGPAWSPDGKMIAFASNRYSGPDYDIFLMNSDGTNIKQLTALGAGSPTWSPDGKMIAFSSDYKIYVLTIDFNASGKIITVDDSGGADYTKIQDAIDDAFPGDTIRIKSGTYRENVYIDKSGLTLLGEDKDTTIIDSKGITYELPYLNELHPDMEVQKPTVYIASPYITVSGFTISGGSGDCSRYDVAHPCAGIEIRSGGFEEKEETNISGNIIRDNDNGILSYNDNTVIVDNLITNNTEDGILLRGSSNNIISGNTITNNYGGIAASSSDSNSIYDNTIENNKWNGIWVYEGSDNIVTDNSVENNEVGISIGGRRGSVAGNHVSHNLIVNNDMGIALGDNLEQNEILNNNISENRIGIHFWDDATSNNTISDNKISKSQWAVSSSGVLIPIQAISNLFNLNTISENELGRFISNFSLHVRPVDEIGNPVEAEVLIYDNFNTLVWRSPTDDATFTNNIITHLIIDNNGTPVNYTPHTIIAVHGIYSGKKVTVMNEDKRVYVTIPVIITTPLPTEFVATPAPTLTQSLTPPLTATPTLTPTPEPAGFELIFALATLLTVAYLIRRRGRTR
jgi:parallel beta-helix repeat protein